VAEVAVAGDAEEDREIILGAALANRATEVAPFRALAGTITPNATREFCLRTGRMLKGSFERNAIGARASGVGSRRVKMQKGILMLRDTWFMAILNCACALCTCVAQPSLLAICLAAVWQAKPLITSATKRSLEF
jgi:hypothetical protein